MTVEFNIYYSCSIINYVDDMVLKNPSVGAVTRVSCPDLRTPIIAGKCKGNMLSGASQYDC